MEKGVPVRSISRSLAALQAVNRAGSLTLQQIATAVELPYASAARLVQTLVFDGYLERGPHQKRYRPTALVLSLSVGFDAHLPLLSAARPVMEALTSRLKWPTSITTRAGQMMVVRYSTHVDSPLTFALYRPGFTMPILECGAGRAYLAHSDEEERAAVFAGMAELIGEARAMQQRAEFEQIAPMIREKGYTTKGRNRFTATPGKTSSIASPLLENGKAVAALSLVFFSSSMTMREAETKYAAQVIGAAETVSAALSSMPVGVNASGPDGTQSLA